MIARRKFLALSAGLISFPACAFIHGALVAMPLWSAALALRAVGTRNARLLFVGDSTTAGDNAGVWTGKRPFTYPVQLAGLVPNAANNSIFADQFIALTGAASTSLSQFVSFDTRCAVSGGWVSNESAATQSFGGGMFNNNADANAFSFSPGFSFDTIDVWAPTNPGLGTLTVDIGGSALATIDLNTTLGLLKTTISKAAGIDTVNIKRTAGNGYFEGIHTYTAAQKEIAFFVGGWSGAKVADYAATNGGWQPLDAIATLQPDLTVINLTINDGRAATNLSAYQSSMQTLINKCKLSGDVILMGGNPIDPAASPALQQQTYINACGQLAASNGLNFVNITARWGNYAAAQASGFMTADQFHPTTAGYLDMANAVKGVLGV